MACVRAVLLPLVVVTLQLPGLASDSHIPALRIRHKTLELGAADAAAAPVNSDYRCQQTFGKFHSARRRLLLESSFCRKRLLALSQFRIYRVSHK